MAKSKRTRKITGIILVVIAAFAAAIYYAQQVYFTPIHIPQNEEYFYVHSDWTLDDVKKALKDQGIIKHEKRFAIMAERAGYTDPVKPGRYSLTDAGDMKGLLRLLKGGRQKPVRITINSLLSKETLAGLAGAKLEADSAEFLRLLNDSLWLDSLGFNRETALCIIIPNTYEYYWNTSPHVFYKKLLAEQKRFWNTKRLRQCEERGYSKEEVYTLASIVEKETQKRDEMAIIAGVYLNRLKKGIRLQADPTVIFAIGNPDIKRVLKAYLDYPSPYNTYRNAGLPPGPICIPSIAAIDAVLQSAEHKYIYFCAREDFSGYHNFAETYAEHQVNARRYQKALNQSGIRQ